MALIISIVTAVRRWLDFFNHQDVKVRKGDSRCWVLGSLLLKCSLLIQRTVWRNWKVSPVTWRPGTCCARCLKLKRSAGIDFSMMPRPPSSSKVVTWMKGKIKEIKWILQYRLNISGVNHWFEMSLKCLLCPQCYWTLQEVADSRESRYQCRRAGISPKTIP